MNKKCPLCKKEAQQTWRPFCSKECKNKDLHRWLTEQYVVSRQKEATTATVIKLDSNEK